MLTDIVTMELPDRYMKMISYHDGHPWTHEQPVLQATHGRSMDLLVLDVSDIDSLTKLDPGQLHTFVGTMLTRFNPAPMKEKRIEQK